MSRRAYANYRGDMTAQGVQKAIASGRIPVEPDGSIDPDKADAALAANTNAKRQSASKRQAGCKHSKAKKLNAPADGKQQAVSPDAIATVREILLEAGEDIPLIGAEMTFLAAQTANEIIKAHTAKLKFLRARGELVEKVRVESKVFAMARQNRDAWMNWPARVAAMMAADLGVDTVSMLAALDKHVREHLTSLSDVEAVT
ncbi:MAG TPA: elements of external origin [Rhodospirillaceae bacterium]|nr:elements of external origin [Rhodospirillaceae bacterium]